MFSRGPSSSTPGAISLFKQVIKHRRSVPLTALAHLLTPKGRAWLAGVIRSSRPCGEAGPYRQAAEIPRATSVGAVLIKPSRLHRRGLLMVLLVLACGSLASSPGVQAQMPTLCGGHTGQQGAGGEAFVAKVACNQPSAFMDVREVGGKSRCHARVRFVDCSVSFRYFQAPANSTTEEVFRLMAEKGLRPATYDELLGFGQAYREEQLRYTIVALGSVDRFGLAPCLTHDGGRQSFTSLPIEYPWVSHYRFLAVPFN